MARTALAMVIDGFRRRRVCGRSVPYLPTISQGGGACECTMLRDCRSAVLDCGRFAKAESKAVLLEKEAKYFAAPTLGISVLLLAAGWCVCRAQCADRKLSTSANTGALPWKSGAMAMIKSDMAHPRVQLLLHGPAGSAYPGSQGGGVARLHLLVRGAGQQQQRRRVGVREGDDLTRGRIADRREHVAHVRLIRRLEVVRARQPDCPCQMVPAGPGGGQIVRVQRQHDRVIGAGGMSHQEHAFRIAANLVQVRKGPGSGRCAVGQESGELHLWIEPVIRHNDHGAPSGQSCGNERIHCLVAVFPRSAVEEDYDWKFGGAVRAIDVQSLARVGAIGDIVRDPQVRARDGGIENLRAGTGGK